LPKVWWLPFLEHSVDYITYFSHSLSKGWPSNSMNGLKHSTCLSECFNSSLPVDLYIGYVQNDQLSSLAVWLLKSLYERWPVTASTLEAL